MVWDEEMSKRCVEDLLNRVTDLKGEGLIVRKPEAIWTPHRNQTMLKIKKLLDSEATVVGYTTGRETDKGSKLLGLMGALKVRWTNEGKTVDFELSGFTDAERRLQWDNGSLEQAEIWAVNNPNSVCPEFLSAIHFPRGTQVTFRYRELTDDGIPKEARFHRKKEQE